MVYVKDASRAVGVCQSLVDAREARASYVAEAQGRARRRAASSTRARRSRRRQLTLAQARANRFRRRLGRLPAAGAAIPRRRGRSSDVPLEDLLRYIDWMPFFNAWEFGGKFPDVLTDPVVGEAASNLYADARRDAAPDDRASTGSGARGRDRVLPAQLGRRRHRGVRRRIAPRVAASPASPAPAEGQAGRPAALSRCRISSRRRTRASPTTSARSPSPPASASRSKSREFEARHDDYNAIMLKALADRLAEALAERCTSACVASSGAMRPRSGSPTSS